MIPADIMPGIYPANRNTRYLTAAEADASSRGRASMSRRDEMALQLMCAMVAQGKVLTFRPNMLDAARDAYEMADALEQAAAEVRS